VSDLEAVLAAMWDDARPRLLARVESLEGPEVDWERAATEAHTLAGTLGTFGRPDGTAAARLAEEAIAARDVASLAAAARSLRAVIEGS
jgi:HPt (histidine-containing phosphotransfer) domain-containing protein